MIIEAIFTIVILIVLAVIGYIIYVLYEVYNSLPTTNCSEFASDSAAIGTENGPKCPPGTDEYVGVCYKDVWTAEGGEKVAVCSVYWGVFDGVVTDCSIGIQNLSFGDPCPMVGEDYHKTALCTCQLRGEVTASLYCQDEGIATICKKDWDYFEAICYFHSCPSNLRRTEICTCAPK